VSSNGSWAFPLTASLLPDSQSRGAILRDPSKTEEATASDAPRMDLQLIPLGDPAETRVFEKGRFDVYRVGPLMVGRATYEPGWRWSKHVAAEGGDSLCMVEHVGLVIEGQAAVLMEDGREAVMKAGDFFYIPPGHDSWVVGDDPYVSLHLMGTDRYAIKADRETDSD
jgi:quercetin dioxygenase-like cupin family protein